MLKGRNSLLANHMLVHDCLKRASSAAAAIHTRWNELGIFLLPELIYTSTSRSPTIAIAHRRADGPWSNHQWSFTSRAFGHKYSNELSFVMLCRSVWFVPLPPPPFTPQFIATNLRRLAPTKLSICRSMIRMAGDDVPHPAYIFNHLHACQFNSPFMSKILIEMPWPRNSFRLYTCITGEYYTYSQIWSGIFWGN